MDCPNCGLVNQPGAHTCDCGYDFELRRLIGKQPLQQPRSRMVLMVGMALFLSGFLEITMAVVRKGDELLGILTWFAIPVALVGLALTLIGLGALRGR